MWANARDLVRRANGVPIRLATKSIRVRAIIKNALTFEGFGGVMTYSLAESVWLADCGIEDILLAYPTVHASALRNLVADEKRLAAITLIIDSIEGLDAIESVIGTDHPPIRVALDVDASLRIGPAHLGVRRSPVHTVRQVKKVASQIVARRGFNLVGVMFYDAQIAGMPDDQFGIKTVKKRSNADLLKRRGRIVAALRELTDLEIVNGGGTGSLELTGRDPHLTELAAGSGLFMPTLFDGYDAFESPPAAYFATSVVRRPAKNIATVFSGGYIASGPAGGSRVPRPVWPEGLNLIGTEGTGEVQTPLKGKAAKDLRIGDRVLFRHAKAGEMCERFDEVALVRPGTSFTTPTYRGEGKNFG